ncbi:MAG: class I SAM-dependent methyltransferase [Proteobacteria bacterium]|nr:class I SAM-dependent methyltransferase [Pseudomonadota bacterium]
MSFYDRRLLSELIGCACRTRALTRQRARLIPLASGRVLELGVGAGANLRFYDAARVTAVCGVDPSAELRAKAAEAPRPEGLDVRLEGGRAEALPYPDAGFDTVVTTFTLCSVPDSAAALQEARRVLKPSGRLLFCEHGLAPDRRLARWQHRLEPAWAAMAGGCRLTRDIAAELAPAGFRPGPLERRYLRKVPKLVGWTTTGEARPA